MLGLVLRLIFVFGTDGAGTGAVWGTVTIVLQETNKNTKNSSKYPARNWNFHGRKPGVLFCMCVCVSVCEKDYDRIKSRASVHSELGLWLILWIMSASPPSSWDPSSDVQVSNRNQLRNSSWGRAGIRNNAAVLWRWWRCGHSAGRPRPCDEWTESLSGLHRGPTFNKVLFNDMSSESKEHFSPIWMNNKVPITFKCLCQQVIDFVTAIFTFVVAV